mgnify:CR=1 FL=1
MKKITFSIDSDDSTSPEEIQSQIKAITDSRKFTQTLRELEQMPPESKSVSGGCGVEVDNNGGGKLSCTIIFD